MERIRTRRVQRVLLRHAPFSYDDPHGKKLDGIEQPFPKVPNGVPGIETRLPLLLRGVQQGRLSLHQFVELTSYQPARLYGLHPRKGSIAIGADADIVMWDLSSRVRIENQKLHHAVDYTLYEGIEAPWPVHCLSRGEVLVESGRYLDPPAGRGLFLPVVPPALR